MKYSPHNMSFYILKLNHQKCITISSRSTCFIPNLNQLLSTKHYYEKTPQTNFRESYILAYNIFALKLSLLNIN